MRFRRFILSPKLSYHKESQESRMIEMGYNRSMTKLAKYLLAVFVFLVIIFAIYIYAQSSDFPKTISMPTPTATPLKEETKNEEEMTFIFAGDAMFGRAVYNKFHDNLREAFENLGEGFFKNYDIAMLNLEGPIVDYEFTPDTNPNNLIMKFPKQTKDALLWLGINAVSLANNHTDNQGSKALGFTRETLSAGNITTIGDPENETDLSKTFQKGKLKITVFAVNILANTPQLESLIEEQKNAGAFVIIFPHWGSEYQEIHNKTQENLAHAWIDAGADMVIGSHPHVVQDIERYRTKPIIYSLGNFLFDQTFSESTQKGLIVKGTVKNKKVILEFLTVKSVGLKPQLLEGEDFPPLEFEIR